MTTIDKNSLETGDMLLFTHKNDYDGIVDAFLTMINNFVGWSTSSRYTHSAIVVKNPTFADRYVPPGLYVLESSLEDFPDAEDNKYKFGVELEHLDKVLEDWSGHVYVRKLHCDRNTEFYQELADAHQVVHDKPYDLDVLDWIDAGLKEDLLKDDPQNIHTFWCSALVCYIYRAWGFLPEDVPFTLITCKSLGTEEGDQIKLHFQNCELDEEVQFK
jgi:hypothetical protein